MTRESYISLFAVFFLVAHNRSNAFSPQYSTLQTPLRKTGANSKRNLGCVHELNTPSAEHSTSHAATKYTTLYTAPHSQHFEATNTFRNTNELFEKLDELYTQTSVKIKCPFFRRRAADLIDSVAMITRFLLIRHKSLLGFFDPSVTNTLPFVGSIQSMEIIQDEDAFLGVMVPPGCRSFTQKGKIESSRKCVGLKEDEILSIIEKDWTRQTSRTFNNNGNQDVYVDHNKGYYITGALNCAIYRDDCLFDGPDPDMPVRGLRKYLSAASKLFDHKKSYADLLDLKIIDISNEDGQRHNHHRHASKSRTNKAIEATWEIGGVIMLPWKPKVKPYTGKTIYHLDENGLVYFHEERWDISVWEAFMNVLFPDIANKIWNEKNNGA